MKRSLQHLIAIVAVIGLVLSGGIADAKHKRGKHHSGHSMTKAKLKSDGKHQIHKKGKHTAYADVKGGKIHKFHVKHDKKGDVNVRKVKSKKKKYAMVETDAPLKADSAASYESLGYCYDDDDDGVEDCYWYPKDVVADDFSSATEDADD